MRRKIRPGLRWRQLIISDHIANLDANLLKKFARFLSLDLGENFNTGLPSSDDFEVLRFPMDVIRSCYRRRQNNPPMNSSDLVRPAFAGCFPYGAAALYRCPFVAWQLGRRKTSVSVSASRIQMGPFVCRSLGADTPQLANGCSKLVAPDERNNAIEENFKWPPSAILVCAAR